MRAIGIVVLAAVLGGCTTVKVVQRDGCWIRKTSRTFAGAKEELGPCTRPQPQWSPDRLTRLVQECVAQADYRWQVRALAAWSRKEKMSVPESQESVIRTCMDEAATRVVTQNETLASRLAEVSSDREALRADATQLGGHLRETNTKLAEFLGEAAKRPAPVATATATATSDGTATTESGLTSETGSTSQTVPPAPIVAAPVVPATTPASAPSAGPPASAPAPAAEAAPAAPPGKAPQQARARRPRTVRAAARPGCEVPPTGSTAAASAPAPTPSAAAPPAPAGDAAPPTAAATAR
jgi:hypothetical protein